MSGRRSLPATVPLGPFDLEAPLAKGGMGTVWRAVHRAHGLPVAVKVVDAQGGEELVGALEHEVRAVAGLDHPHVIRVYEQGRVERDAVRASGGQLRHGSPWFAMELADAGQLSWRDPLGWPRIRSVLLALLDALAHAHARGVLHRDLKPANVLFSGADQVLKLTDFGMGWTWDAATGEPPRPGGTPQYMAPEQFTGEVVLQGPWTDLYSVGCLAHALVCRRPPYPRGSWHDLRTAHLERPFPTLVPRTPVPAGFDAFLGGLVAKNPAARFPRAADAALALSVLPDADGAPDPPGPPTDLESTPLGTSPRRGGAGPARDQPTLVFASLTPSVSSSAVTHVVVSDATHTLLPLEATRGAVVVPPMPVDWRRTLRPTPPVPAGLGLGLYGLRPIPMVDRDVERDTAWQALAAVRADRRPRAVVVQGLAGSGKSRLAEWLCVLAEELGIGVALRATHGAEAGPLDGLAGLVARAYRISPGLDRPSVVRWVARGIELEGADPEEAERIGALLRPADDGLRLESEAERHAVVLRLLRRVARDRPVICWIDDAQWDADAVAFVRRCLEVADLPALLLLTVQEEGLADRPAVGMALDAVAAHERGTVERLGPLPKADALALARGLLGLSADLATRIEERTQGNPLYAVQLVGDWVERGLLVEGVDGFELVEGADLLVPDSIAQLWEQRVRALVRDEGDGWRFPLEVAAVLGDELHAQEWTEACERAGLLAPPELLGRMQELRLARPEPGSRRRYRFVHGLFRESVATAAERGGRAARWHRACAGMLEAHPNQPGVAERRGRHLLAAGDWEEAVDPMLVAIDERVSSGQPAEAEAMCDRLLATFEGRVPGDDPRLVQVLGTKAQTVRLLGRMGESTALAERAVANGGRAGPRVRIAVLRELAQNLLYTAAAGERSYQLLAEATSLADADGDREIVAALLVERGRALEYHGRFGEAAEAFEGALALFTSLGAEVGVGDAEIGLASIAYKSGRVEEAERRARASQAVFHRLKLHWRDAYCETLLGEVARFRGDMSAAEASYRAVIAHYEALVGPAHAALPRANLGLVLCATRRFAEARDELSTAGDDAVGGGLGNLVLMIEAFRAWAAAGLGDWATFDDTLARARDLPAMRVLDPDLAIAAREAGDLAAAAGEAERARAAWALSLEFWERLGDPARAAEVQRRLGGG